MTRYVHANTWKFKKKKKIENLKHFLSQAFWVMDAQLVLNSDNTSIKCNNKSNILVLDDYIIIVVDDYIILP